jgi:hypothetical protein
MGLTVLIFVTLLAAEPKNSLAADLNGIWVADLAVCNFRALPRPNKLLLRVSRYHNQLEVTEVHSDQVGKSVVQRRFLLSSRPQALEVDVGIAKMTGRTTILRSSGHLEEWRLSVDGNHLTVNRWRGTASDPSRQTLILNRSTPLPELAPLDDSGKPLQRK